MNIIQTFLIQSNNTLHCVGKWRLADLERIKTEFKQLDLHNSENIIIDGKQMAELEPSSAWFIINAMHALEAKNIQVRFENFSSKQEKLLLLVKKQVLEHKEPDPPIRQSWIYKLGENTVDLWQQFLALLDFTGKMTISILRTLPQPHKIRYIPIFSVIENAGYRALPIVALLSMLIGVVLAYQMGLQLQNYGANIFVVDLLGLSIVREFGPLLTAIIIAGRTASAFTAEIGTMVVNEEIDALETMGVSPIEILVLPKFYGLVISLPLLTIWATGFGLFGGMLVANSILSVSFHAFLTRFSLVVTLKQFAIGMSKTPIFASVISGIGCYQGMQVSGSAESVGLNTTMSVVKSIFLIIIVDAIFSILFGWRSL